MSSVWHGGGDRGGLRTLFVAYQWWHHARLSAPAVDGNHQGVRFAGRILRGPDHRASAVHRATAAAADPVGRRQNRVDGSTATMRPRAGADQTGLWSAVASWRCVGRQHGRRLAGDCSRNAGGDCGECVSDFVRPVYRSCADAGDHAVGVRRGAHDDDVRTVLLELRLLRTSGKIRIYYTSACQVGLTRGNCMYTLFN